MGRKEKNREERGGKVLSWSRDGLGNLRKRDGNENSHILPTGQWYAPSAIINDALIMQ